MPLAYGGDATVIDATGRYILTAGTDEEIVGSQFKPIGVFNPGVVELYERDTCMTSAGPVSNCTPVNFGITVTPGVSFQDSATSVDTTYGIAVSKGGRFVAFSSEASDLVSQNVAIAPGEYTDQVYLRDTCNEDNNPIPGCTPQTILVSQDNSGNAAKMFSVAPSVSDDGRFVAFSSSAALAPLATAGDNNVFLRDNCLAFTSAPVAGCAPSTSLVTVNAAGTGDAEGVTYFSQSLSADGRFVAFEDSSDTITAAGNQGGGVYVRDSCHSSQLLGPCRRLRADHRGGLFRRTGRLPQWGGLPRAQRRRPLHRIVSASNFHQLVGQIILAATGF